MSAKLARTSAIIKYIYIYICSNIFLSFLHMLPPASLDMLYFLPYFHFKSIILIHLHLTTAKSCVINLVSGLEFAVPQPQLPLIEAL